MGSADGGVPIQSPQRSLFVRSAEMTGVFAGVDVGGTSVKLALGTDDGELLAESSIPTDSHRGPEAVLHRIAEGLNHLSSQVGQKPSRIGMGIPGIVDIPNGVTKFLPNLMGHWKDVPAAKLLSGLVGCPVTLLNDVRTATLGELAFGHGRNPAVGTFVLMAIGTGIGGGVVIDRKLRLGRSGPPAKSDIRQSIRMAPDVDVETTDAWKRSPAAQPSPLKASGWS